MTYPYHILIKSSQNNITILQGMHILDVFQPGLTRGSEHLAFDPEKAYAYVEDPIKGWRVYLRSAIFIHEANQPFQEDHFLVFRNVKKGHISNTWEPPKGQMEGKDFYQKKDVPLLHLLAKSALRETQEEGHLDLNGFKLVNQQPFHNHNL